MVRIAIVEDDQEQASLLETYIRRYDAAFKTGLTVTVYYNVVTFLEKYQAEYDLIFMDIMMPMMNGLDASRLLREKDDKVILVFVTSMRQYAIHGYDVGASDFIVKPVAYAEFSLKFTRILSKIPKAESKDVILRSDTGFVRLSPAQIRYVEVRGHHCVYHAQSGEYAQYQSMKSAEEQIDDPRFVRCNNYLLINLAYVEKIENLSVWVGGEMLPISHPRKKAFTDAFGEYVRSRHYV